MGLFDDVLEPPKPARKGGLFDDVLPAAKPEPETGLFDALTKRLGSGVTSKIGGGLRFLGETLSPDVRGLSPNVAALADVLLPQRLAGNELTGAGTQAVDYASTLRQEAGGERPKSIMDALQDPTNTAKYYGGTLVESLPEILAGIATRNPAAANAIIAGATGSGEYGSARQQGLSQFNATQQAGTNALVEAALGKTPLETAFGAAPFLTRAGKASLQEAGTEALNQAGQDILPRAQRGEDVDLGQVLTNAIDAALIGSATGPIEALGGRQRAPELASPARDLRAEQALRDSARAEAARLNEPGQRTDVPAPPPIETTPDPVPVAPPAPVAAAPAAIPLYHQTSADTDFRDFRADRPTFFATDPKGASLGAMGSGRLLQAELATENFANTPETPVHFMDVTKTFRENPDADAIYVRDESGTSIAVRDASKNAKIVGEVTSKQRPGEPTSYTLNRYEAPISEPEVRTNGQAESEARTSQEAVQAPEAGVASPDEFTAKTKGGTFRLRDVEAPAGTDFSEFGQVREVTAFDGDTEIGKLVYANDGTPPTIEVNPDYRRKGVATAMLKLAKERGGVLGEGATGIRGRGAEYRTPEGQAFRSQADEGSVELSPFVTEQAQTPAISEPAPAEVDSEQVAEVQPQPVAAEPAPVAPTVRSTGIANADVTARREAEGRAPLIQEARRTNQETIDKAVSKTAENPRLAAETVAKLNSGQAATLDDEAVLFVDAVNLRKQRDSALDVINDPNATEYAKEVAQREYTDAEARIEANEQASKAVGTESGRLLQLRRRMLADDYSLISLERKVRQSQGGKALSQEQTQKIRELSKKIEELTARAEAAEAQTSLADSVATYDDLLKSMQAALKGPRKRPTLDKLREAANESRAALASLEGVPSRKGQSGAAINPVAFYHLARIGAYHIANGAASLADFTARMRADLGAKLDEFREMLPAVFQAAKEQAKVSREGPSIDSLLAKVTTPTAKDVKALAEAHIRAGLRGEGPVLEAVASSLNLPVADVRRLFVEPAKRGNPQTLDAAKAELRDLRNQLRKADAQGRAEMRQAQREASKAPPAQKVPVDAETRYQETRNKDLRKRIAELESRIAAGDFARPTPRTQRQLNRANEEAQLALEKAKEEFGRLQIEAEFSARTPIGKVLGHSRDVVNLARALMTSLDFSGLLRQGGFISFGHPVRAAKAVPQALKAFGSERAELAARQEIEKRPNYRLYKQAGLDLTGIGTGPLTKVEEAFASRLLNRVPRVLGGGLIRGSGRSYTTLLNRLRADSFDSMVAGLSKTAKPTAAEAKAIANYINVATGRGKIGLSENVGETLNTLFFAPRLVASRFQLLAGQPLYGGTNRTRSLVAQDYARFLTGVGITLALASLMKDEDDDTPFLTLDPRSADFGKARFGNTYLDPLAGLAQVSTFVSRLATGETKSGKGVVKPIRPTWTLTDLRRALGENIPAHKLDKEGGLPFGSSDAGDVIGRFLRTKLAPVPGAILNTVSGSDLIGKPVTPGDTLATLVTPMSFNDVGKVMEEQGIPRGSALWLLSLLGMGMQYRQPKPVKEEVKKDQEPKASMVPSSRKAQYVGFKEGTTPQVAPEVLKGARNAPDMVIVGDWSGLPENVRNSFDNGALGVFDPNTKTAYVANGLGEKEAKLTAYHEIAGHYGLQGALGNDYESVLNRARQNPTVDQLSEAMGKLAYTKLPNKLARTEEALSELAAALRADDYNTIEERWGVKIPQSARPGIRGMLGRVVQMTKRKLSDLIGDEPQAFDDDQVHSLIEDAWKYVEQGNG